MADHESLFSLEVVVESLESIAVPCLVPAIAFRLLDFPTLVIRKEQKTSNDTSDSSLVNIHGTYSIHSGKSCLFKMNKEMLLSNLERTPLYIMLVDVSGRKVKLLASTTISLTTCFKNVLRSIEISGLDVPTVHGSKEVFELYNLMGTPIAVAKLSYRIFSLGGTINGHVKCTESLTKQPNYNPCVEDERKARESFTHNRRLTEHDGKDLAEELVSGKTPKQSLMFSQLDVETQTDVFYNEEPPFENYYKKHMQSKSTTRKENINVARPPPLYYNSRSTPIAPRPSMLSKHLYSGNKTRSLEKIIENKVISPRKCNQTVSLETAEQINTEELVNISRQDTERRQLVDLPLINALLRELSLAKQSILGTAQQSEQPDANYTEPKQLGVKLQDTVLPPTKPPVKEMKKIIPYSKGSNQGNLHKSKPQKPNVKGVLIQRNPVKFRKSVLKSRTTKTQKLREALNKKKQSENTSPVLCEVISQQEMLNNQDIINKRPVLNEPKETQEFGCQVSTSCHDELKTEPLGRTSGEHHETQLKEDDIQVSRYDTANIHVAVQHLDMLQFNKADLQPSADQNDSNINSTATSESKHSPEGSIPDELCETKIHTLNLTMPEHYQEHISPGSNSEWSSHSKKSTSSTILPGSVKPTFSNLSPTPATKNSRYTNKGETSVSKETRSSTSASSSISDLVGKPVIHLSKSSASSFEHNYSDKFDSFQSEHKSDKTESNSSKI